jgi:hypothetical protein
VNRRDALARASAEHRRAVADCSSAIRSLEPGQWREPARPGGWTRAEIAEHLAIAYGPPLSELSGGPGFAVRLPWWKWRLLRWKVLPSIRRGGFPKGAPAPREIRPASSSEDPDRAARRLAEQAEVFLQRLEASCRERPVRLTHAYFGKLSAVDVVRLLTSHAHHHRRQLSSRSVKEEP